MAYGHTYSHFASRRNEYLQSLSAARGHDSLSSNSYVQPLLVSLGLTQYSSLLSPPFLSSSPHELCV